MTAITVLEETSLDFVYDESVGAFVNKSNPSIFLPVSGEEYRIIWDGEEWLCTAYTVDSVSTSVFIGNTLALGGVDTGEPFFYGSLTDGTGADLYTFSTEPTHTMAVFQDIVDTEEPEETGIILKDRYGTDVIYKDVQAIKLNKVGGGTQTFVKGEAIENIPIEVDFSDGDHVVEAPPGTLVKSAVIKKPETLIPENITKDINIAGVVGTHEAQTEEKTISLDFSNGDMSVEPNEGKLISKINVPTPETLIPENIAEGINIAGIIGTLAASSGGGARVTHGTVTGNGGRVTVNHGLGQVPKLIIVGGKTYTQASPSYLIMAYGLSQEGANEYSSERFGGAVAVAYNSSKYLWSASFALVPNSIDVPANSNTGQAISGADETSFCLGSTSSSYITRNGMVYYWFAIA